jgi:hypothetical protein
MPMWIVRQTLRFEPPYLPGNAITQNCCMGADGGQV